VILVTLEATAFGNLMRGIPVAMALLACLDSRQQYIGRIVALGCARVARRAGHHAVGVVIEFGMLKPANGNC
jgi:hypothetical protein